MKSIHQQIADLTLRREENKFELYTKEAERARNKELFFLHGEGTSLNERLRLDSEIAHLQADRQRTKVELMRLKKEQRDEREASFSNALAQILTDHGLDDELNRARERVFGAANTGSLFHEG